MLAADGNCHLRQQALNLELNNSSYELVTSADFSEVFSSGLDGTAPGNGRQQAVNLGFRNAMVTTWRLYSLDLAFVDPLLQRRIAHTEHFARMPDGIQFGLRIVFHRHLLQS